MIFHDLKLRLTKQRETIVLCLKMVVIQTRFKNLVLRRNDELIQIRLNYPLIFENKRPGELILSEVPIYPGSLFLLFII